MLWLAKQIWRLSLALVGVATSACWPGIAFGGRHCRQRVENSKGWIPMKRLKTCLHIGFASELSVAHYLLFLFFLPSEFSRQTFTVGLSKSREDSSGNNLAHDQQSYLLFWSCPHCPCWISLGWVPKAIWLWWAWWIHPVQMRHSLSAGNVFCEGWSHTQADVTTVCKVCLSHCLVLPPSVEMAAACTCTHGIRNTLIARLSSPANEELGAEKHCSSRAKGWQCS